MSIKKVMTMFALLMGIACASYAQGVTNDSTATAKEDGLELVKDVYPQTEEDGDLYHGLTKKLMFDRMIPPHGLEVTYDKTVHILFPAAVRYVDLGSPNLIAGKADGAEISVAQLLFMSSMVCQWVPLSVTSLLMISRPSRF